VTAEHAARSGLRMWLSTVIDRYRYHGVHCLADYPPREGCEKDDGEWAAQFRPDDTQELPVVDDDVFPFPGEEAVSW